MGRFSQQHAGGRHSSPPNAWLGWGILALVMKEQKISIVVRVCIGKAEAFPFLSAKNAGKWTEEDKKNTAGCRYFLDTEQEFLDEPESPIVKEIHIAVTDCHIGGKADMHAFPFYQRKKAREWLQKRACNAGHMLIDAGYTPEYGPSMAEVHAAEAPDVYFSGRILACSGIADATSGTDKNECRKMDPSEAPEDGIYVGLLEKGSGPNAKFLYIIEEDGMFLFENDETGEVFSCKGADDSRLQGYRDVLGVFMGEKESPCSILTDRLEDESICQYVCRHEGSDEGLTVLGYDPDDSKAEADCRARVGKIRRMLAGK